MAFSGTKVNFGVLNENNKSLIYKEKATKRYGVQHSIGGTHNPLVVSSSLTRPTNRQPVWVIARISDIF